MTISGFSTEYALLMPNGQLAINPMTGSAWIWADQAAAEQALQSVRANAVSIGVTDWAGVVVRRYSTPFIGPSDPSEQLVADLSAWLKKQTGGQ